jgi:hypothetical protein
MNIGDFRLKKKLKITFFFKELKISPKLLACGIKKIHPNLSLPN